MALAALLVGVGMHPGSSRPAAAVVPVALTSSPTSPASPAGPVLAAAGTSTATLHTSRTLQLRAAMITSTLENSDTTLQYGYAENIGDGRGITAGRAGFTSGTGDLLLVVQRYAKVRPKAGVVRYLPALKRVDGSGSIKGLSGLPTAWRAAASDAAFRRIQDDVVEELYLAPALTLADKYRVRTPLGQAILWDTSIQHGIGGQDGLKKILSQTFKERGYATSGEAAWLRTFLAKRLYHLLHWSEGGFIQSPSASRARIATWRGLLAQRAFRLPVPLTWRAYGDTCAIDAAGRGTGPCR